jgi:hypothetical protein
VYLIFLFNALHVGECQHLSVEQRPLINLTSAQ